MTNDAYSQVAADQLDKLQISASDEFWDAIMDSLELILKYPGHAQKLSAAFTDDAGRIVFRLPIRGFAPHKIFWTRTDGGARVEAVFPHE
ncbi:uncharacterized protein RMCFA_2663 [Mycolicibacterium fortuitum subsp. acetamidolyticum]|uniref:Uncharacterized protein n=1 Tax=Mycolicibacterium fortuitum subsp. acetamidolyticum TaxID=144550 RepID=A0A100WQJ6_MYCFO|nr:hypothetical protein [Mycolicibacterium fortuitum]MCV7137684.1 hypothetical protein [Mycolicibacterium fortuitum]GAT02551.1 uncharacterized protein RMCFA_2663 [Mycolicibacterium fortuitum subsp. acetamidolyticum]